MESYAYQFEYDDNFFKFISKREVFDDEKILVIQRSTCRVKQLKQDSITLKNSKKLPIHLIMGIITIRGEPFLIVVKEVVKVGRIISQPIYQIRQITFIAFRKGYNSKSYDYSETVKDLDSIKQNIINDNFYFCYHHNITLTLQKRYQQVTMQQMFFWNQQMLYEFRGHDLSKEWMIPILQGYVKGFKFRIKQSEYYYTLISRRSKFQSGTRYISRGADQNGYVANYIQCEQIYCFNKCVITWVLLRGSVPLYWSQTGIGSQIKLVDSSIQKNILNKHMKMIQNQYHGRISVIDLLSDKSSGVIPQNQLQKKYKNIFQEFYGQQNYINFDLNQQISKNKKDVQGVIDRWVKNHTDKLCGDFFSFGYGTNSLMSVQTKYIRVNCLDCLDRTNVICFKSSEQMFKVLQSFLNNDNIEGQRVIFDGDFRQKHREAWLENGDRMSIIYSGTTSVASYLTKGQKSNGLFNSLGNKLKSLNRFYNANINDSYKQQCIDWVLRKQDNRTIPYFERNIKLNLNEHQYCELQQVTLGIITWNCAQVSPSEVDLGSLLELPQYPSILIVCLQEIIELNTYNVLLGGNKGGQNKWIAAIERLMHLHNKKMMFVGWKDLVGVLTMMFVGEEHFQRINSRVWSEVKTGWKGNLGNKGSVGLSFKYDDSIITILNCHLQAGEGKVSQRLLNIQSIHANCFPSKSDHQQYQNSQYRFFAGDLNFRIDLNQEQIKQSLYQIQKQQRTSGTQIQQLISPLLAVDQLLYQMAKKQNNILNQYDQAPISFLPTYKYVKKSDKYDFKRVPSWCDRILYHSVNPVKLMVRGYNRKQTVKNSDHRPVFGIFNILVKKEDKQKIELLKNVFMKWST